jgi:hypothetical protein
VATYVRNAWGNAAAPVSNRDVAKVRHELSFGPGQADAGKRDTMAHPGPATWSAAGTDSRDNGTANAGRAAPASEGDGGRPGAGGGGASQGHPAGVTAGGPG